MAAIIARVVGMLKRLPVPYEPPVQPVLTRYTLLPKASIRFINNCAYTPAGRGKKGAPKQVENVERIAALEPISVDPTSAV